MSNPAIERIKKAHKEGALLAHMFEFSAAAKGNYEPGREANFYNLFEVMNGNRNALYDTFYHTVEGGPNGFVGLPTTALKQGMPVQLYRDCESVGLLLDANDSRHVTPLMVGSSDLYSKTKNGILTFGPNEMLPGLDTMQHIVISPEGMKTKFDTHTELEAMAKRGRRALSAFWEKVNDAGWLGYTLSQSSNVGMNEVTTAAQLKGIRGLIVNEVAMKIIAPAHAQTKYVKDVRAAKKLRDWLHDTYPQVFPEKLPILSYNPEREHNQLMELTEEKLINPRLPREMSQAHGPRGHDGSSAWER